VESTSLKYFRRLGQTIYAPATALGGPVVTIRVSGSDISVLKKIVGEFPEAGSFSLRSLMDPITGEQIDKALVLFFKTPHSFTGEDVVEIQMHGVTSLVNRLFLVLEKLGIQLALPGEFSFRAVKNERMTLVEAEGLQQAFAVDGIRAEVASGLLGLSSEVEGRLNQLISEARDLLRKARGRIEAGIDFSEAEEEQATELKSAAAFVNAARQALLRLVGSHENFARSSSEIRVAIVGSPNVGKSTLFNILCGVDRALVSPIAGTTRDVIDVRLKSPLGNPFRIFDTAGIRETLNDEIEERGISRGLDWANRADFVIQVNRSDEITAPLSGRLARTPDLRVQSFRPRELQTNERSIVADLLKDAREVSRWVFAALDKILGERNLDRKSTDVEMATTSDRQIRMIRSALSEIALAEQGILGARPLEIAGDHLMRAEEHLQSVVGHGLTNEYIGEIFSQFCLGK
jgi:tRNA modification GTPase